MAKHDQEIEPWQMVGDDPIEDKIRDSISRATRVRDSLRILTGCKTSFQLAAIPAPKLDPNPC